MFTAKEHKMNTKKFLERIALSFLSIFTFINIAIADGKVRITNEDVILPKDFEYANVLFLFENNRSLKRFPLPHSKRSNTEVLPNGTYQRVTIHIKSAEKNAVRDCIPEGKENYLTVKDGTIINIMIKQDGETIRCTLTASDKVSMADS